MTEDDWDPDARQNSAPQELQFPTAGDAARVNRLILLIEEQRRLHGTPATERTKVDRRPLEERGFTAEEIDRAEAVVATWEGGALKRYGKMPRPRTHRPVSRTPLSALEGAPHAGFRGTGRRALLPEMGRGPDLSP